MDNKLKFTDGSEMTVGTMYCIGQNYSAHVKEMGSVPSTAPLVFLKPASAYVADGGKVELPSFSQNVHHEVELVVVIGKECRKVSRSEALSCVAGYAVGVDFTLRDVQSRAKEKGHPWAVAKGFFSSGPISKVIPASQIAEPFFDLQLKVNGDIKQKGTTRDMERSIEELIEYLSSVFMLLPGDVIFTGTPEGVGPVKAGDKIEASLVGLVDLSVSAAD